MNNIIVRNHLFKGIPYNEFHMEDTVYKGLIFMQHGYLSNKERGGDYLALPLARLGYKVICLDAYKHGERIEEPYISGADYKRYSAIFEVITHTANDIEYLFQERFADEFETYDLIGVSMGGMIGFYLLTIPNHVSTFFSLISTPSFLALSRSTITKEQKEKYGSVIDNNIENINQIDPINRVDKMTYDHMVIYNTLQDPTVPGRFSEEFYNTYRNGKMEFAYFEGAHEVTREMKQQIYAYYKK